MAVRGKAVPNIDFVICWVDDSDPIWQKEKTHYLNLERGRRGAEEEESPKRSDSAASDNRYRDWGLLPYWFRGVERFAPWVHKIYFVTCGQRPDWLNVHHPKLVLVDHKDYIPGEYLPTFNSNTIEMHLHRISGLEEQFVYFNDDFFLTAPVTPDDFFVDGRAVEPAILSVISPESATDMFPHILLNNLSIINTHFQKRNVLRKQWRSFYSLKYGKRLLQNLYLSPSSYFNGFRDDHLPSPYLKRYFEEVWSREPELLAEASRNRFRGLNEYSAWLVKNWQFCVGASLPRSCSWGRCYHLGRDGGYCEAIRKQQYKSVCLNDSYADRFDFEKEKGAIQAAFEMILPEPSEFEVNL